MGWELTLIMFFVLILIFIFSGAPVAFAFLTVNIILVTIIIGFVDGLDMLVLSAFESISKFSLTPIPLFVLMGELLFHSGLVMGVLNVFSRILGNIPSRLSLLSIGTGTLFAALSGSSVANSAMLGSTLVPEMRKRNYHLNMTVGPILATGSLAMIIPPSNMVVILGGLAKISVGDLLIAGIIPGLMIAVLLIGYFLILGIIKPEMAPKYEVEEGDLTFTQKLREFIVHVVPVLMIIGVVLGGIFTGIATPTESAALGTLGALILTVSFKKFNREILFKTVNGTLKISGMILLILAGSAGFSQLLAFTGSTRSLIDFVVNMDISVSLTIIIMLIIILLMGTFIEGIAIVMITVPLFMPILHALDVNLIWFGILMLICVDMGGITPPFGLLLFVMKGALQDVRITEIYKSVIGIVVIMLIAVVILYVFPPIITWLPSLST